MTVTGDAFRPVGSRVVAIASFLVVERVHVAAPEGEAMVRIVVRHPGAVAIVPIDGDDVVLMRQHRVPVGRDLLEIPAGKLDVPGESLLEAAERELAEEVGLAGTLTPLVAVDTTPGFCDERISIFLATDLRPVPAAPHGAEERAAVVVRMGLLDAVEAVLRGDITDGKTIAGLFAATQRR